MGLFNGLGRVGWTGFSALLVAVCATGCGGGDDKPSGGSADFTALQKEYASPTGTLHAEDKDAIFKALGEQNASPSAPLSTMPHTGMPGGPKVLDTMPFTCGTATASGVVCTCEGGGSMTETVAASQGSSNISGSIKYNACKYTEGTSSVLISGSLTFADITSPPPSLFIYKGSITETLTPPGETVTVNLNYALSDGKLEYTVDVSDGNLLVAASGSWDSTTDTGSFTVTTKDGTSTCTVSNGAGSCSGPGGNVTFS